MKGAEEERNLQLGVESEATLKKKALVTPTSVTQYSLFF